MILLLLACARPAASDTAQCAATLTGRLQAGAYLLPGETIEAIGPDGAVQRAETNTFGAFTFELRPGDWTLTLVDSCHVGEAALSIAACANQAPTIEAISQCVG